MTAVVNAVDDWMYRTLMAGNTVAVENGRGARAELAKHGKRHVVIYKPGPRQKRQQWVTGDSIFEAVAEFHKVSEFIAPFVFQAEE